MTPARSQAAGSGALVTLALFVSATVINLVAARWLDGRGAFTHIDTLFNADAPWYLCGFVDGSGTGTSWGPRSIVHPNVANLVHPLVAALGQAVEWLRGSGDTASISRAIALGVCPVVAGAETTVLYRVLRSRVPDAALLAAIGMATFSTVLFGATPESFGFTGLGIALTFWVLETEQRTNRRRPVLLTLAGAFLVGITITNVILFAIGVGVHRRVRGQGAFSLRETAFIAGSSVFLTFVVAGTAAVAQGRLRDYVTRFEQLQEAPILRALAGRDSQATRSVTDYLSQYTHRAVVEVPRAFAYSFVPPVPDIIRTPGAAATDPPIAISYQQTAPDWRRIGPFLLALVAATLAALVQRRDLRPLGAAALAIVVFNWGFHTVFGEELLLYSKHWTTAVMLLLCALANGPTGHSTLRRLLLSALLLVVAGNTAYVFWRIGQGLD